MVNAFVLGIFGGLGFSDVGDNIGAVMVTYTILGVPYYNYSRMGPKTLF